MWPRGDALLEADWSVGQILDSLERLKLTNNTLVIFTSDNGPVVDDGYKDDAVARLGAHKPAGRLRGGKGSNFEGGTRVPFITRWPGQIKRGVSDALVSQVDLLHSFASFTGRQLAAGDAPDSFNVIAALLGQSKTGRDHLIQQASALSLRAGNWKYIEPSRGAKVNANTNTEMGNDPGGQLYDLSRDPGEQINLATQQPDKTKELAARIEQIKQAGRSRR
jgi:arylsulfatase A-like enzyme